MKLIFADEAWEDYLYWQKQDRKMVERINKLIREIQREPFAGIGKPEPLKHALSGFWSRRITDEHRVVYRVDGDALWIAQLRFHYLTDNAVAFDSAEPDHSKRDVRKGVLSRSCSNTAISASLNRAWRPISKSSDPSLTRPC